MPNQIHLLGTEENIPGIHKKYEVLFSLAENFWKEALSLMPAGEKIGIGKSGHLNLCLSAVYAKQTKLFWSVYTHCYSGLGGEAFLPLRTMYQVLLNLAFLEKGVSWQIARQWLLWDYVNDLKQLKNQSILTGISKKLAEELEISLLEVKNSMSDKDWKNFVKNGPSKLDMASLALKVGMEDTHSIFYPYISGATHGYDLMSHVKPMDPDGILIKMTPDDAWIDSVLITAMHFMKDSLEITNRLLSLGKERQISKLTNLAAQARTFKPAIEPMAVMVQ